MCNADSVLDSQRPLTAAEVQGSLPQEFQAPGTVHICPVGHRADI